MEALLRSRRISPFSLLSVFRYLESVVESGPFTISVLVRSPYRQDFTAYSSAPALEFFTVAFVAGIK